MPAEPSPTLAERAERLAAEAADFAGVPRAAIRLIRSPHRICPLGAHVDHQLGRVTGMAIDRSILLAFAPTADRTVRLKSHEFDGLVEFALGEAADTSRSSWGCYAAGAVGALARTNGVKLTRGIAGVVEGGLPIGGLSSSAAVSVAYLLALEAANDLTVNPVVNIRLEQYIENVHIGLNNGILDQSVILLSRRGKLLVLDCQTEQWELVERSPEAADFGIVVAYSGVSSALAATGYNTRVKECRAAAGALLDLAGIPDDGAAVLRDVPFEVYEAFVADLPPELGKRARHFFTENVRVLQGRRVWAQGDLVRFGELITESGRSSIENYECGSPELITLYDVLCAAEGVYGARFSGGGFRGSCLGLYRPGAEEAIRAAVDRAFPSAHPHLADRYELHFCTSDDGAAALSLNAT